jgi:hypothetical protein
MDDQTPKTDLQKELDQLLADIKKDRRESDIKAKVLIARADRLTSDLEKTDFSDLIVEENKAMKDLHAAVAEEVSSLELEEEKDPSEE